MCTNMRVVFTFGIYIVTESVMGLWWFWWIVFSFSCIGLATSFTSSKSYCINSFLFSYQILCCCEFCKCFIKLPLIPSYLHQIQHMNMGTKCQHMRQLAVLQFLFEKPEKLLVLGLRLSIVPCESPSHGEPLWFSAGPFLMRIIS